jgi:two-component system, sensor histidine kinase and response regulator
MNEIEGLRILIADDEAGMRAGVRRSLEGLHISDPHSDQEIPIFLDEAADGREAQSKLAEQPVDILMLDHSMPGCTGMEILEDLQREGTETLTIMVTAFASLEMAVRATKQGAFDFLAKPFTPGELRRVVEKAARHLLATRAARDLAKDKRRVRFEFLSVLAHELKAPLGAVEGYLRLLDEGVTDGNPEAASRAVNRCLVRLEGMRKLIFDLLDLTRIESGQKQRELGPVDVGDVLATVLETFTPEAESQGIDMTLELATETGMQGEVGELEIIFNNLVSNAVKYNRPAGRVEVRVDGDEHELRVEVQDTGIGMTEEEAGRLFGEFVRIKNEKTKNILGSGLGLSIVRRLARLNGGDVTVQSRDGEGTNFTVALSRTGSTNQDGAQS